MANRKFNLISNHLRALNSKEVTVRSSGRVRSGMLENDGRKMKKERRYLHEPLAQCLTVALATGFQMWKEEEDKNG